MPTTDRLEMLVNLDESQARTQVAGLERRGLTMPLGLEGGRAGGRMPGGVRGLGGLGRLAGTGRMGSMGGYMARGGAAQMILGGGMMAGMLVTQAMDKKQTWGQVIASGAVAVGSIMAMASPEPITKAIGIGLMLAGTFGPKIWDYFYKGAKNADPFDLGAMLKAFGKDLPLPPPPAGEGGFFNPFEVREEATPSSLRDAFAEMQAALHQEDLIGELRAIRRLLGRVVLQGNV